MPLLVTTCQRVVVEQIKRATTVEVVTLVVSHPCGVRIRPLAAGASGCALVVLTNSVEAHRWGCVPHRGCCFSRRSLNRLTRPLGPAGVIGLADPVELPYWNKTEMCHALHVTLAPFSLPSTVIPRSTNISHPVEVYFYSSPVLLKTQGFCITTASHSVVLGQPLLCEHSPRLALALLRWLRVVCGHAHDIPCRRGQRRELLIGSVTPLCATIGIP
jgi:hypothetical protein